MLTACSRDHGLCRYVRPPEPSRVLSLQSRQSYLKSSCVFSLDELFTIVPRNLKKLSFAVPFNIFNFSPQKHPYLNFLLLFEHIRCLITNFSQNLYRRGAIGNFLEPKSIIYRYFKRMVACRHNL